MSRVLVAGIGNVFAGDDGFGVAVIAAAKKRITDPEVTLLDVGIRTLHLAYELANPWSLCIVVDAIPLRTAVGTLRLVEPRASTSKVSTDAHGMDLDAILATTRSLGATPPRILLLGCEVADVSERMELSHEVEAAVERAVAMLERVISRDREATKTSDIEEQSA